MVVFILMVFGPVIHGLVLGGMPVLGRDVKHLGWAAGGGVDLWVQVIGG